jgi:DNA-binding transcriptional ArsR family regulator
LVSHFSGTNFLDDLGDVYYHLVMQLSGYAQTGTNRPPGHSTTESLDATFGALADPTRRAILARLAQGDAPVNELAEPFAMTQPAISKHLKVLERAGLITRDRDAQRRPRHLNAEPLAEASAWLDRYREFWGESFARLDQLLVELQPPTSPARTTTIKKKRK